LPAGLHLDIVSRLFERASGPLTEAQVTTRDFRTYFRTWTPKKTKGLAATSLLTLESLGRGGGIRTRPLAPRAREEQRRADDLSNYLRVDEIDGGETRSQSLDRHF
jgi:hypothetical protein